MPSPNNGAPSNHKTRLRDRKYFSRRWVLAYSLLMVRVCQTALRQCIGMALVCMTHREHTDIITSTDVIEDNVTSYNASAAAYKYVNGDNVSRAEAATAGLQDVAEFQWTSSFEGHVLSAYYYGFLFTVLLAGYVDRALGSRYTIALALGVGALVNLLTPPLTRQHRYCLVALRVVAGCANGLIDPSMHTLWANWAPVSERGQLTAVEYAGNGVGGILTFLISGFLCKIPVDRGWPFVFYFYGAVSLLYVLCWLLYVRDRPADHPTITLSELNYIMQGRSPVHRKGKVRPPWPKILKSGAVWAIIVAHMSFSWVFSWVLAYLPMYMEDVLQYDIAQNGVLSSLPFLGKLVAGLAGGYLADLMLHRHLTISFVRKFFQMVGSMGCAIPVLIISFLDVESRVVAVVLLVVAVSLQNLTSVAYRINSLDIAPRYASFLMSMTSTLAVAVTLTAPLVTSALLTTKSREEWQTVLWIVTGVSVLGGVVFLIFARGDVQDWACDEVYDITITQGLNDGADLPTKNNDVTDLPAKSNDVTDLPAISNDVENKCEVKSACEKLLPQTESQTE